MKRNRFTRKLKHLGEYTPLWLITRISRVMSFSQFSNLGGRLGRLIGFFYPYFSSVAEKNIHWAFPNLTEKERKNLIIDSCENITRTFFEYFVYDKIHKDPEVSINHEDLEAFFSYKKSNRPILFISAHYGNWEIGAYESNNQGFPVVPIYRTINNPYVDRLILNCRSLYVPDQIPKGKTAGLKSIRTLKKGTPIVILADQKNDQGLKINFFNKPAPTADGFIKIAQSVGAILVPIRISRVDNTNFYIQLEDPIDPKLFENDDAAILLKINKIIESWIKDKPEQWFWFHRRWDKKEYKPTGENS